MNDKVKQAISAIDKKWGKGQAIVSLTEKDKSVKRCPTGSLALDIALGGGYPYGRIIEVFGPESSGKSTLVLEGMVQAQKLEPEKMVAYIDSEFAFDPVYAENLGLDLSPEKFVFAQPEHGEQVFDVVEELLKTGEFSYIAIDSVAAMIPRAELEGEIGESKMGLHARLMSQGMRKLVGLISKSNTILYFTNQLRDNIGVLYGNPEVTTGGNALKFYASQRLDIRKSQTLKDGETAYANNVRITVKKNKVAPPFTKCETTIEFGQGISLETEIVNLAIENGLIQKSGSWLSCEGIKVQGIPSMIDVLKEDLTLKEKLVKQIKKIYNLD